MSNNTRKYSSESFKFPIEIDLLDVYCSKEADNLPHVHCKSYEDESHPEKTVFGDMSRLVVFDNNNHFSTRWTDGYLTLTKKNIFNKIVLKRFE